MHVLGCSPIYILCLSQLFICTLHTHTSACLWLAQTHPTPPPPPMSYTCLVIVHAWNINWLCTHTVALILTCSCRPWRSCQPHMECNPQTSWARGSWTEWWISPCLPRALSSQRKGCSACRQLMTPSRWPDDDPPETSHRELPAQGVWTCSLPSLLSRESCDWSPLASAVRGYICMYSTCEVCSEHTILNAPGMLNQKH